MKLHYFYLLAALTASTSGMFWKRYIFVDQMLSWSDARALCRNHYSDLATIENQIEFITMKNNTAAYRSGENWIGLYKKQGEIVYTEWSDGSPFEFDKWENDEPSDPSSLDCVYTHNDEWYDNFCNIALKFICYKWEPIVVLVKEMKTWPEALDYCRTQYIDMISLPSNRDMLLVKNQSMSAQTPSIWINLHFLDGSWFWVNNDYPGNLQALPSCPIRPFRCGAKTAADVLENRDCEEKMNFICYHY